jgi:hypothetical protein
MLVITFDTGRSVLNVDTLTIHLLVTQYGECTSTYIEGS